MGTALDLVARQPLAGGPDLVCYGRASDLDLFPRQPFAAGPDLVAYPLFPGVVVLEAPPAPPPPGSGDPGQSLYPFIQNTGHPKWVHWRRRPPRSSAGVLTSIVAANEASWELRASDYAVVRLMMIGLVQAAPTAASYGIGRPAAAGVAPGVNVAFQRDNPLLRPVYATVALTWGTGPTAPAVYMRRWNSAALSGVGIVFTFRRFLIRRSESLVVFNITAAAPLDVDVAIREYYPRRDVP